MQIRTVAAAGLIATMALGLAACGKGRSTARSQGAATPASPPQTLAVVQGSKQTAASPAGTVDDAAITRKVHAKLSASKELAKSTVVVKTKNGVVFLSGTADSDAAKKLAGQLASQVDDVKVVVNEVKSDGGH